jgi:hypothetical protein
MATEAPSAVAGAARLRTRYYIREAKSCSGAEWSHPLFSGKKQKVARLRHDSLIWRDYWGTGLTIYA